MQPSGIGRVIARLTENQLTYQELNDLYASLQTDSCKDAPEQVNRIALAHVIGEIIDYLDEVSEEFEKSIGLSRSDERKRILNEFSKPGGDDTEQVAAIIAQWRAIDRYSIEDISRMIRVQSSDG